MTSRVSKSEMRKYMKELRTLASKYNCKLKVHYKSIIWSRYGNNHPNFGEVRGYYASNLKEITVVVYGRPARRKVLDCVAHEIRHAEHDALGLFADYYRPNLYEAVRFIQGHRSSLPKGFKPPCNKTAYLAEIDCNHWADKFLKRKGIKPVGNKYYYHATFAHYLNARLNIKK